MSPLGGLKGLYADPQDTTDVMDEGVLEAKANALHPSHSETGVQAYGYSGTVPSEAPFGAFAVYDGWDSADAAQYGRIGFDAPGEALDVTPTTHSSPYPRGLIQQSWDDIDALARVGEQIADLHALDLGGPRQNLGFSPVGREQPTHYTTDRYDAPNQTYQAPDLPGQIRTGFSYGGGSANAGANGGGSNADTVQGYGQLNPLGEFQMGHSIRRVQHDHMPWDYTNTHGEQNVPFPGRHPVQQMPLNGPDSPYFEMGNIDGANIPWEGRIGYPTPYQQPSEPTIVDASHSSDVWAWS